MGQHASQPVFVAPGLLGAALCALLAGMSLTGCTPLRSLLRDAEPASDEVAARARSVLVDHPLASDRRAQIALEWNNHVFVALGFFVSQPPESFHAELTSPFGVTMLEVVRDRESAQVLSGADQLQTLLRMGELPRALGLWLLGTCDEGPVWDGFNGVAVDCPATGPDEGLTWRVWLAPELLEAPPEGAAPSSPVDPRIRGELLKGTRRLADFTCQPDGDCLLQDPVHGYVLRIVSAPQ